MKLACDKQMELSGLRDTVTELEAGKASVQQELQRYQQLYVQQLDVSTELRRQLHTAKQLAAAATTHRTQPTG